MRALFSFVFACAVLVACAKAEYFETDDASTPDAGIQADVVAPCPGSQTRCASACTDTSKDVNNCGKCGARCAATQYCSSGKCSDQCVSPNKLCGQFCVDITSDHDNCGSCGKGCLVDQECKNSTCIKKCPQGLTVCDMSCVDVATDPNHCGDCNTTCGVGEICTGSTCCKAGLVACNGVCTDTNADQNNCGACGLACGGNTPYCTNGKCGQITHGTSQLSYDYSGGSGGCGDFSIWYTQNFGQMTYDQCEVLANQYGAQFVGAPSLYN
jgi:hypothetical protein